MNKKLFHIEFKNAVENEKHFYYGDLTILCNIHKNIGISKFTFEIIEECEIDKLNEREI